MARRKKEIVMPHLNDCGGDLKKKWYVEYSIRNPQTDKMERVRMYEGINEFHTCHERYVFAKKVIADYEKKLQNGQISYQEFVEYEDLLLYDGEGCFSTRRTTPAGSMRLYLSEFLQQKKIEVSAGSMRTYTSELRMFYLYLEKNKLTDKPVSCCNTEILSSFLHDIAIQKELSNVTVGKYKQILNSFFNFVKTKKAISENPVNMITANIGFTKDCAPAAIPTYMRKLLHEKIEPADPQLWMFICFMYYTAIRPGIELRLMRLNQINYASRTITIHNYTAKNNRTETIDLPDFLYDMIIKKWKLNTYNQELYIFGRCNEPGDICLGKNNMKNRFNHFRDDLKLPKSVKLYSWKHSGAQELADNGTSIYELQRHLRHRDITTTEMYLKKRIGQRSSKIKHDFPEI